MRNPPVALLQPVEFVLMNDYNRAGRMKESSPIVKVSDIGQFVYCSVAWYLERHGHKPDPILLRKGLKGHMEAGKEVERNHSIAGRCEFCSFRKPCTQKIV